MKGFKAAEKKYYWLKLKTDFFNQREIKKLRKIAGGDTFTIIYLKMQLLSVKNDGVIMFEGTEEHFDEQLSLELDEDIENVRLTLSFLYANMLIEPISDEKYLLPKVCESIGSESNSAERVRKHRQTNALQCNTDVTPCNAEVTKCNTEIEKEIEKEIELDIEIEKENISCQNSVSTPSISYQKIVDLYHSICVTLPRISKLTDARRVAIKARWNDAEKNLDAFEYVFHQVHDSDFLSGRSGRWTSCNFDWIMKQSNFLKVGEGNYTNKGSGSKFEQGMNDLEKWVKDMEG